MGRFALLIGNSQYNDARLARLVKPAADVHALAEVLRDPDLGGFDQVIAVLERDRHDVEESVARLFAKRAPDDLTLLYYSGHGIKDDDGHLFLACKNSHIDLLLGSAVASSFVTRAMEGSRANRQILILDCCHSGAFTTGFKGALGTSAGTKEAFAADGYGRVILTASDSTQYAFEGNHIRGEAKTSLFTGFLIDGIRTGAADTDGDGNITVDELYAFIYQQISRLNSPQRPQRFGSKEQGALSIAKSRKRNPLSEEYRQAARSPLLGARIGVISDLRDRLCDPDPEVVAAARSLLHSLADDAESTVRHAARQALVPPRGAETPPRVRPAPAPVARTRSTLPTTNANHVVAVAPPAKTPTTYSPLAVIGIAAAVIFAGILVFSNNSGQSPTQPTDSAISPPASAATSNPGAAKSLVPKVSSSAAEAAVSPERRSPTFTADLGRPASRSDAPAVSFDPRTVRFQSRIGSTTEQYNSIHGLAFGLSGTVLAAGSGDRSVRTWSWPAKDLLGKVTGLPGDVKQVQVCESADLVLWVVDRDRALYQSDTSLSKFRKTAVAGLNGLWLEALSLTKDCSVAAISDGQNTAVVALNGTRLAHLSGGGELAFSPDAKTLAVGSFSQSLKLWEAQNGSLRRDLKVRASYPAFDPSGRTVAAGTADGRVRIWRVNDGTQIMNIQIGWEVVGVAFSPAGDFVAAITANGTGAVIDVAANAMVGKFEIKSEGDGAYPVASLTFAPDATALLVGTSFNTIQVWGK